jgi:UDP-N-acetylglucosamine--dolichyl-phosphate N-acetylglucosaminephosphotransferase
MFMIDFIISIILSFIITYLITPYFIKFLESAKIVGIDVHKANKPKIAEMGGPPVLIGFLGGVFFYIFVKTFFNSDLPDMLSILITISTAMMISIIGIFDDLGSLIKRVNGKRIGIKRKYKVLFPLIAAIPLISIRAGYSVMSIPFVGSVDFGILYPLLLVPLIVAGMSNAFNMISGMNGLEAGLGVIYLSGLGIFTFILGKETLSLIAFSAVFALIGFLKYNWYPAKIMPGDSLVYFIGAIAASIVILGNIEKFATIAFIPWFIELILKLRVKLNAENFGILQKDGTLKPLYKKIYSLTSLFMHIGKFKEKQIVTLILLFETFFVILAFLVYFKNI